MNFNRNFVNLIFEPAASGDAGGEAPAADKQDEASQNKTGGKSRRRNRGNKNKKEGNKNGSKGGTRYARNPELLKAASSYGFSYVSGQKLPFSRAQISAPPEHQVVPGIMTLGWEPSLGGENAMALNQSLNSIYSFVVHANSRNMDKYNAMDQGCFILAGISFFAYLRSLQRVYGYMQWVTERNEYAPAALIEALGFDYYDLQRNLSKMWFDLNHLVTLSRQIWIPTVMPLLEHWLDLNSVVYTDGASLKSQYYVYVPSLLYMVDETISDTGTALRPVVYSSDPSVEGSAYDIVDFTHNPIHQMSSGLYTWQNAMDIAFLMLNALIASDSRGLIFGDILKAYGADKIYAAAEIPVTYQLAPVFEEFVLSRIENTTITQLLPRMIVQNQRTNMLNDLILEINTPDLDTFAGNNKYPKSVVLNMHKGDPTPEDVLFATEHAVAGFSNNLITPMHFITDKEGRLAIELGTEEVAVVQPRSTGTEVITTMNIFNKMNVSLFASSYTGKQLTSNYNIALAIAGPMSIMNYYAFDWAPWIYYFGPNAAGAGMEDEPELAIGDFDNYTILGSEELYKLHTAVVYDAYGVPVMMG